MITRMWCIYITRVWSGVLHHFNCLLLHSGGLFLSDYWFSWPELAILTLALCCSVFVGDCFVWWGALIGLVKFRWLAGRFTHLGTPKVHLICCMCCDSSKCVRCSCIQAGTVCSLCLPSRHNHCSNLSFQWCYSNWQSYPSQRTTFLSEQW